MVVLVDSNDDNNAKRCNSKMHYLPKDIVKNCSLIIIGKNFYEQPIDSNIKQDEDIIKLAILHQIGLVGNLKHADDVSTNCVQSKFVLTILENIKEMKCNSSIDDVEL